MFCNRGRLLFFLLRCCRESGTRRAAFSHLAMRVISVESMYCVIEKNEHMTAR